MQFVSDQFTANTKSNLRQLYWKCFISFTKEFDSNVDFFTIGTSDIGGIDIIKGEGDVVQEWDQYAYTDYSERVIDFEYTREQDPNFGGSILSTADITLDNHDDLFTPNFPSSPLKDDILPWRPVRLHVGFSKDNINESVPVFVGLIEKMPQVDYANKTVKLHCIDFLQIVSDVALDSLILYQDKRTDELISILLQEAGLTTSQFILDVGFNTIPYFFTFRGDKVGDYLRNLAASELGNVFMDENGVIRFNNRTSWLNNTIPIWAFTNGNTLDKSTKTDNDIINVAIVKASIRDEQANANTWQLGVPVLVPANSSINITADFTNPVVTVDNPVYIASATTSLYETNAAADGSGATLDSFISLSAINKYSTNCVMTFANSNTTTDIYITNVELWTVSVTNVRSIYERVEDATSITNFLERAVTIENDFIQDESTANSIGEIIVQDNKDFSPVRLIDVMGIPQLQIGDLVSISDPNFIDIYYVSRIISRLTQTEFVQTLTVIKKTIQSYFTIGESSIGGDPAIAP